MGLERWQNEVERLLPDTDLGGARVVEGTFHEVVLVPGVAAIRVARDEQADTETARQHDLLRRLGECSLPFAVPEPLDEVQELDGRPSLVCSWVPGNPAPKGHGDPEELRELLAALADVDLEGLRDVLAPPHAYAGGERWAEVMFGEAVPRLPGEWQQEARRRVEAALALEPVPARLVHGDLAGDNMRWDDRGRLVGVLDWDLASPWDQAVDAACLAWHGWETVRAAVDDGTYRRARIWYRTFGIEQIAAAIQRGEPDRVVEQTVVRCVRWLGSTADLDA
ncbi:MAG: phosphotransferase [Nitriliruptorales bacterium]|nr:phosphotransferase [Nitriliruptorales bacterium]